MSEVIETGPTLQEEVREAVQKIQALPARTGNRRVGLIMQGGATIDENLLFYKVQASQASFQEQAVAQFVTDVDLASEKTIVNAVYRRRRVTIGSELGTGGKSDAASIGQIGLIGRITVIDAGPVFYTGNTEKCQGQFQKKVI